MECDPRGSQTGGSFDERARIGVTGMGRQRSRNPDYLLVDATRSDQTLKTQRQRSGLI